MNKFTLPTLEERLEYKKQEDEKWKKRIEESAEKLWEQVKTSLITEPNDLSEHIIFYKFNPSESVDIVINKLTDIGYTVKKWYGQSIFSFYKLNQNDSKVTQLKSKEELQKDIEKHIELMEYSKTYKVAHIFINHYHRDDLKEIVDTLYLNGFYSTIKNTKLIIKRMTKFEKFISKIKIFVSLNK